MKLDTYTITFKNLAYFLNFGLLPEEQTLGQRIFLDVTVSLDSTKFSCDDKIETVFDYRYIDGVIKTVVKLKRYKLLEHLAKKIAEGLFSSDKINSTTIAIRKPSVPISEVLDFAEVSLTFINE